MARKRIVFWQTMPSPHQSSYIKALGELLPNADILGVYDHSLNQDRRDLGWNEPNFGRVQTIISPDPKDITRIALNDPENSINLFGGLRTRLIRQAFPLCASTKALIGLMSEARDWREWKGKLRLIPSYAIERHHRKQVDFVLAIGHQAIDWFKFCGFPEQKIFPWGYCVENGDLEYCCGTQVKEAGRVIISFVGQCIERKGVGTLLEAVSALHRENWRVQIIGDGPLRSNLVSMVERLGIASRVSFLGVKKNSEVIDILSTTDILVLPSKFDGWGAVVNEALMIGTPVVCSDCCGAAELIRASGFGEIFTAGSTDDLGRVLEKWIGMGPLVDSRRDEIRKWSKCIAGESMARYLIKIFNHLDNVGERPIAPWFSKCSDRWAVA